MSEVMRYDIDFARGHSIFSDAGVFVLSSDYDAALAKIAALQLLLNTADQRNADLEAGLRNIAVARGSIADLRMTAKQTLNRAVKAMSVSEQVQP